MMQQTRSLDQRTGVYLFIVALVLYACTGSPYPVPGESAWLVAAHTGVTATAPLLNPVWGQVARAISWIPIGPLAFRLNLFSALCGAGAVWALYLILRRLPVRNQILSACPHVQTVIGLCGALYLMVSLPLWHASNRAHYDSFDLLLFLASVYFLQSHLRQPGPIPGCLFAFLYGLGLVESSIFVIWAPFLAAVFCVFLWVNANLRLKPVTAAFLSFVFSKVHVSVVLIENLLPTLPWKNASRRVKPLLGGIGADFLRANAHLRVRLLTFMTLALLLGLSDCLLVVWHYLRPPIAAWYGFENPAQVVRAIWYDHTRYLIANVGKRGWMWLFLLCILPLGFALLNIAASRRRRSRGFFVLLPALLFTGALVFLLNFPVAPWLLRYTRPFAMVPSALVAAYFALSAGIWFHLLMTASWPQRLGWARAPVAIGALFLCLVTVPAAGLTWYRVQTQSARLFHFVASEMLDSLGQRQWLVTDGLLDPVLQILAADRRQPLKLLNMQLTNRPEYLQYLAAQFDTPRFRSLALFSPRGLLREWSAADPEFPRKVAVQNDPFFVRIPKHTSIPSRGIYLELPADRVDPTRLAQEQKIFWEKLCAVSAATHPAFDLYDRRQRSALLQQLSKAADEFGTCMARLNQPALAQDAYRAARRIDARNPSAFINLYHAMSAAERKNAEATALLKEARGLVSALPKSIPLPLLESTYGPIHDPASVEPSFRFWGPLPQETVNPEEARQLEPVRELLRYGYVDEAIAQCRELLKSSDSDAVWNLLGIVAFQHGDLVTFQACLTHMKATGRQWPSLLFLEGKMAFQSHAWVAAKRSFDAVYSIAPNDTANLEYLIRLDLISGQTSDRTLAYLDQLLALDPAGAFANFALAYMHSLRGQHDLAEVALRRSGQAHPDPAALGQLAWILHLKGNDALALECVRRSLDLDASSAATWDTLGVVLMGLNRLSESEEALNKAMSLDPAIADIQLHYLQLLVRTERREQAIALARQLLKSGIKLEPTQQEALAAFIRAKP